MAVMTRRAAAVMAAVLAAGACLPAGAGAPGRTPGWHEVARLPAGRTPGPVTLGGKWAFVPNTSDGTVTQIDRAAGRVVATIRVSDPKVLREQGCAPDSVHAYHSASWGWRACDTPYALAWDGGSLWAIDNGLKTLVKVDPRAHRVTASVALPGTGWDVAAGATTAWVTGWDDDALYVVDTRGMRVLDTITGLDHGPAQLALAGGSVWVVCARGGGRLDRIDAATAKLTARTDIEWWSLAATARGGDLYLRGTNGGDVYRVDTGTGATLWTVPSPGFIGRNGIDEMAATGEGVWVDGPSTVLLDRAGRVAERLAIPSSSVAAGGGELWISRLDGTISEMRRG